ncbi:MAG: hypothetical protein IPP72_22090 [Chitinophagaceae bacterium]|nr:hypothetical protein [Chitinophagaceae bacterium]
MRTLITLFIILIGNSISAQKNFEGKINYKMNSNSQDTSTSITAYFGKQKIKAVFKQRDSIKNKKDDLLIDFENGVVNYINAEKNTYRTIKLQDMEMDRMPALKPFPEKNKQLLGYNCTAYITTDTSKNEYISFTPFYFWYADSLFFKVKNEYSNIDMVPIFTNGNTVGMGMQMNLGNGRGEVYIELTPVSILKETIPDSVFSLARLQFERKYIESSSTLADSTQILVDSISRLIQQAADSVVKMIEKQAKIGKKSPSRKTASKNTHKQPTKPSATKPKE